MLLRAYVDKKDLPDMQSGRADDALSPSDLRCAAYAVVQVRNLLESVRELNPRYQFLGWCSNH